MSPEEDWIREQYSLRAELVMSFFQREATAIAVLCHQMAKRFFSGGRLLAFGLGAAATDAQHVSVEFVHPVIVGKRALPAIALPNDSPTVLGFAAKGGTLQFARQLELMGRAEDMALGIIHAAEDESNQAVSAALKQAALQGMLTISLNGPTTDIHADHIFTVPSEDPFVVQELQETLYHVLWELVHVFFDHKGLLLPDSDSPAANSGRSSFLYPFLDESERNLDRVLLEVSSSVARKAEDVVSMRSSSLHPNSLAETGRSIAERIKAGGKVITMGNGGSATDAQDLVTDLMFPPRDLTPVSALSLTNDSAVITAVGNDVGFDNVFARQIIAIARPEDVVLAISTSGGSRNVLSALKEASKRGAMTIALCGYGGGPAAALAEQAHVIDGDYIPRIQEAQATQYHLLRRLISRPG